MRHTTKPITTNSDLPHFSPQVTAAVREGLLQYANSLRDTLRNIEQALVNMTESTTAPTPANSGRRPWYVDAVMQVADKTGGIVKASDLTKLGIKQPPKVVMAVVARRAGVVFNFDRKSKAFSLL